MKMKKGEAHIILYSKWIFLKKKKKAFSESLELLPLPSMTMDSDLYTPHCLGFQNSEITKHGSTIG